VLIGVARSTAVTAPSRQLNSEIAPRGKHASLANREKSYPWLVSFSKSRKMAAREDAAESARSPMNARPEHYRPAGKVS